nr:HAD family phosphatase [Methylomonas koyamae]
MNRLRLAALIFDMDGLVLDTETTYFAAWRRAAADIGCELTEQFCAGLSGCSGEIVRQRLQDYCGAEFDVAAFQQLSGVYWTRHVERHGIAVKPGFRAALAAADRRGLNYALATNSRRANAERCLQAAGLQQVFSVIVTADNAMQPKPRRTCFCARRRRWPARLPIVWYWRIRQSASVRQKPPVRVALWCRRPQRPSRRRPSWPIWCWPICTR